jgi:peptide/nickel transport system substrate-binding protein
MMQRVGASLLFASFIIFTLLLLSSIFISSLLSSPTSPNSNAIAYGQDEKKGAYVDQINFVHYLDENVALQDLKVGKIDTYFFNIPLEVVSDTKNDPNLNVYDTTGGSEALLLNPAPSKNPATGDFNPFSIKQVRFAMNYLLDRDFIVNEILKGYGSPMNDPFGLYSPEYLNIIDTVQSFGFRHNPELAQKIISDALKQAGAVKDVRGGDGGKWAYNGKPITIKILIRGDISNRKSIGELVASNLETFGFDVVRDYGDLNKANSIIYGSDPQDLKWNIYEEQFASSGFAKYEPGLVAQMYAPWSANMPGTQNPSFWNYKNTTLDTITQKIIFGNYTSENERNNLLRSAVKNGIQESVRIFIAKDINPYVATKNVKGLINDFGAGITSRFSLINGRFDDTRTNNINVGMKQIYVGAWNGVAGFKDAYSTQISSTISDPGVYNDPYTGEVIPVRTPWTDIQTNGPHGKVAVSPDAIIWDPVNQRWKKVSENNDNNNNATSSISKVTYDLKYSKWHNGIMMDKNDLLYSAYFVHEWGTNTGQSDKTVDSEDTSQAAQSIKYDKGIRFLSDSKVESYYDFWHFDNKEIAGAADIWAGGPWEIAAASERLVTAGKFAFSRTDSTSKGVDWLSLIIPSHATAIKEELQKMKAEGYVPVALRDTVNVVQAKKRYDASINWITQHNNAIIGNGPFYLDNYNPAGGIVTIKAFRDNSYPFEVGYWNNKYEHPKLATIENINDVPRFIRIGQPVNIGIQIHVDGKPSNNAIVNYYLSNSNGSVVLSGVAKPSSSSPTNNSNPTTANNAGIFTIDLSSKDTAKLSTGPSILKIFANSLQAYKPYILTKTIIAVKRQTTSLG